MQSDDLDTRDMMAGGGIFQQRDQARPSPRFIRQKILGQMHELVDVARSNVPF
jgi:hypothetical protein